MCIAVTVSRVVQIQELKWVVVALIGIALYDYFGVVGTQQLTDGGASIMEAVAIARSNFLQSSVDSGTMVNTVPASVETYTSLKLNQWQPGLLQMVVGGRTSDIFGLGILLVLCILDFLPLTSGLLLLSMLGTKS